MDVDGFFDGENQKQHLGKLPRWAGWQPALPGDKS
jgi:hypothetical protein